MELKEVIHKALKNPNSETVKVFLHTFDTSSKKKPVADGKVGFNKSILEENKDIFEKWVDKNIQDRRGVFSYQDFATPQTGQWTEDIDDVLMLLAALQVLGFGKVVGNTEQEEILKSKGFTMFPMFKFN